LPLWGDLCNIYASMHEDEFTYKKAGVDIGEGDRFVARIAPLVKKTFRPEVLTGIGSFGALFNLDISRYRQPVLVSGTDGVGTKLKVAFLAARHDTVGIDLVAMCVNDILTSGAEPLFFLDYFATGKLRADQGAQVIEGIVRGCQEAGCALVGGETAEMPGFYAEGEYDLSGFAVGAVERDGIVDGSSIEPGDVLVGLLSSGLHSNGYSLVRKVFFEKMKMTPDTYVPELGGALGEELLRPTRIYVKGIRALLASVPVKGMAHVTGGGIPGNLPRILPEGVRARVNLRAWQEPPVFGLVRDMGKVPEEDMRRTFNLGIGFIIAVKGEFLQKALECLEENGYYSCVLGTTEKGERGVRYVQD
jgi:phosphoribosylformylglycinamidine cyclo-ligase